jgi:phosphatidylserine decarboxylase
MITVLWGGLFGIGLIGLAEDCLWCWPVMVIATLAWTGGLLFFRDPDRSSPSSAGVFVAPADGSVTDVGLIEHDPDLRGPAVRMSIFLSIFDVHVNRSPCAGIVQSVRYRPGGCLDARDPRSGATNEANAIVIKPDEPTISEVVVRQIAGRIARRIVCLVKPGDRVERGQRIGMIKFGSRTELVIAGQGTYDPLVKIGDRTCGAVTVMARVAANRSVSR